MICEECQQREAMVFLTQIIHGEMTQLRLCESCAEPIVENLPAPHAPEIPDWRAAGFFSLAPDPTRPTRLTLPDPVTVHALAASIHVRPFEIVRDLMALDVFVSIQSEVSFATASELCVRYGITATKVA